MNSFDSLSINFTLIIFCAFFIEKKSKTFVETLVTPFHYGTNLVIGSVNYLRCYMFECCQEPWISKSVSESELDCNFLFIDKNF